MPVGLSPSQALVRAARLGHRVTVTDGLASRLPTPVGQPGIGAARTGTIQRRTAVEQTDEALRQDVAQGMKRFRRNEGKATGDSGVHYIDGYRRRSQLGHRFRSRGEASLRPYRDYIWNPDYENGFADPAYWHRVGSLDWQMKDGVRPSLSLDAWFEGLTLADCASVMVALQTQTLRRSLGDRDFDHLFGAHKGTPWQSLQLCQQASESSVGRYLKWVDVPGDGEPQRSSRLGHRKVRVGEWVYVANHPGYLLKHPAGAMQGENAIYVGDDAAGNQLFTGFGMGPVTERQMLEDFRKAYNAPRTTRDYRHIVLFSRPDLGGLLDEGGNWKNYYDQLLEEGDIPQRFHENGREFPDHLESIDGILTPEVLPTDTRRWEKRGSPAGEEPQPKPGGFLDDSRRQLDATKVRRVSQLLERSARKLSVVEGVRLYRVVEGLPEDALTPRVRRHLLSRALAGIEAALGLELKTRGAWATPFLMQVHDAVRGFRTRGEELEMFQAYLRDVATRGSFRVGLRKLGREGIEGLRLEVASAAFTWVSPPWSVGSNPPSDDQRLSVNRFLAPGTRFLACPLTVTLHRGDTVLAVLRWTTSSLKPGTAPLPGKRGILGIGYWRGH